MTSRASSRGGLQRFIVVAEFCALGKLGKVVAHSNPSNNCGKGLILLGTSRWWACPSQPRRLQAASELGVRGVRGEPLKRPKHCRHCWSRARQTAPKSVNALASCRAPAGGAGRGQGAGEHGCKLKRSSSRLELLLGMRCSGRSWPARLPLRPPRKTECTDWSPYTARKPLRAGGGVRSRPYEAGGAAARQADPNARGICARSRAHGTTARSRTALVIARTHAVSLDVASDELRPLTASFAAPE